MKLDFTLLSTPLYEHFWFRPCNLAPTFTHLKHNPHKHVNPTRLLSAQNTNIYTSTSIQREIEKYLASRGRLRTSKPDGAGERRSL